MGVDKILVVIPEPFIRKSIEECLRLRRYGVHGVGTLAEAERLLQREFFDLVLLEIELPDGPGADLLERLLAQPKRPLVAMLSAAGGMETVADCLRIGAFDYLLKPFGLNQVELLVRKAEAFQQIARVNQHLTAAATETELLPALHPAMARLQAQIRRVGPTEATVLIEGEAGSGKSFFARQLHRESHRATAPFLEVDCRTLPEELLESQLFGHEKGVLPGAHERRDGRLELAHGGTLLLEAVDALPPRLQEKLLRFLLTREFQRLGSARSQKADVRILATVRENLLAAVDRGTFQENLFYRLNVLPLRIPPLRERGDDILPLAEALLQRLARRYGREVSLTPEAGAALLVHSWPGNVRELELALERALIGLPEEGAITPAALGLAPAAVPTLPFAEDETFTSIHVLERQHIFRALDRAHGNRTRAADLLGISVRTLRNKLHEYHGTSSPALPS